MERPETEVNLMLWKTGICASGSRMSIGMQRHTRTAAKVKINQGFGQQGGDGVMILRPRTMVNDGDAADANALQR